MLRSEEGSQSKAQLLLRSHMISNSRSPQPENSAGDTSLPEQEKSQDLNHTELTSHAEQPPKLDLPHRNPARFFARPQTQQGAGSRKKAKASTRWREHEAGGQTPGWKEAVSTQRKRPNSGTDTCPQEVLTEGRRCLSVEA